MNLRKYFVELIAEAVSRGINRAPSDKQVTLDRYYREFEASYAKNPARDDSDSVLMDLPPGFFPRCGNWSYALPDGSSVLTINGQALIPRKLVVDCIKLGLAVHTVR